MSKLRRSLRALENKNYRIYFFGLGVSFVGTWMQRIGLSWLAYRLTNSSEMLGIVSFATLMPSFVLSPVAGALSERWNRRKMLIVTQIFAMIQALLLYVLVLRGDVQIWHLLVMGIFLGIVIGFDLPVRQAFVAQIVNSKEDLGNAIALNSLLFNGARLIGPAIAGYLIKAFGESTCFLANGLSYLVFLIALERIQIVQETARESDKGAFLLKLKEGIQYACATQPIKVVLVVLSLISLFGMPYFTLAPVFARDVLQGGPETLGVLMTCAGIGAMFGGAYLLSRISVAGLEKAVFYSVALLSLGMIVFSQSIVLWLSMAAMFIIGAGLMVAMASCNTILQTVVDDDKRGRVMSFYTMTFLGLFPLGSLLSGELAEHYGAPLTLCIQGTICLTAVVLFAGRLASIRQALQPVFAADNLA
ncbi:MFS transporter [bacterium]|nr:MFS transporter [bacterium]MCP5462024.1 MFS transporter [bacterium]